MRSVNGWASRTTSVLCAVDQKSKRLSSDVIETIRCKLFLARMSRNFFSKASMKRQRTGVAHGAGFPCSTSRVRDEHDEDMVMADGCMLL